MSSRRAGSTASSGTRRFWGDRKYPAHSARATCITFRSRFSPAGDMDLVGFFFRRNFALIKDGGYFGLIATNTIAQGGTREGSLEPIARQGGEIVFAVRSMKWQGLAAVSVSLIAMHKGKWDAPRFLDGREVARITPYLDDSETLGNPYRLKENAGKSFQRLDCSRNGVRAGASRSPGAYPEGSPEQGCAFPLPERRGPQRPSRSVAKQVGDQLLRLAGGKGKGVSGLFQDRGREGKARENRKISG